MQYLLTASLGLVLACSSAQPTGITATCGSDSTLTYANFGEAFISTNCLECHASRDNPRLGTQAEVVQNADRIIQEAVESTSMPEDGDLSTEERQLLGEWLACGAP